MSMSPESAIAQIASRVSAETGLPVKEIMGKRRTAPVAAARAAVMFEARQLGFSYPLIGRLVKRDHTTAVYAVKSEAKRRGCDVPGETLVTDRRNRRMDKNPAPASPQVRKMSPEETRRLRSWRGSVHYRGLRFGQVSKLIAAMPVEAQHALEDRASRRGETLGQALVSAWLERVSV